MDEWIACEDRLVTHKYKYASVLFVEAVLTVFNYCPTRSHFPIEAWRTSNWRPTPIDANEIKQGAK